VSRFVHEISTTAALLVLAVGLWQDRGTLSTLERMLVAFLCSYALGAGLAVAVRFARQPGPRPRRTPDASRPVETGGR